LRKGKIGGEIYKRGKMRERLEKGENRGIQEGMQGEVEKNNFIKFL
jgi:hypothetical protein